MRSRSISISGSRAAASIRQGISLPTLPLRSARTIPPKYASRSPRSDPVSGVPTCSNVARTVSMISDARSGQ